MQRRDLALDGHFGEQTVQVHPVEVGQDLLARRLDDRHGWQDATETALTLAPAEVELA